MTFGFCPAATCLFNTGHGVKEVTREKKVVFDYESASEIYACQRLTNGNTFIGECSAGRLLEVNPAGKIVKEIAPVAGRHEWRPRIHAQRASAGQWKLSRCALRPGSRSRIRSRRAKWCGKFPPPGGPHSVVRLPNGNTLISCADGPGGSRVFEVDAAGQTVWQVQGNELPGVSLRFMAGLERLPNGDTLMANWLGHRNQFGQTADLIEVTPDKRVVWKFFWRQANQNHFQRADFGRIR